MNVRLANQPKVITQSLSETMSVEKIAAIKAKRLFYPGKDNGEQGLVYSKVLGKYDVCV